MKLDMDRYKTLRNWVKKAEGIVTELHLDGTREATLIGISRAEELYRATESFQDTTQVIERSSDSITRSSEEIDLHLLIFGG